MKSEDGEKDFFSSESEPTTREGRTTSERVEPIEDKRDDEWEMDWSEGEEIIVHEQRALAVYENNFGGIVVRQERGWDEEDDVVIVLACPSAASRLIEAIQNRLNEQKRRKG